MTAVTQASGDSHTKDEQEINLFCPESYLISSKANNVNWHEGCGNRFHIPCELNMMWLMWYDCFLLCYLYVWLEVVY